MHSSAKDTVFSQQRTLRLGGRLISLEKPLVMGILNLSPESFYRHPEAVDPSDTERILAVAGEMLPYCDLLDIGGVSTRPGSEPVSAAVETERILKVIPLLKDAYPETFLSVDTYRASVAISAVAAGAHMVNDISGGSMDPEMIPAISELSVPYVLSHIRGTPATMQIDPHYDDLMDTLILYFARETERLRSLGVHDIILDPGFGFGKTVAHNYHILRHLDELRLFGLPILAGLSRKSFIQKVLDREAAGCLNGTSVLNTIALMKGAAILRVHDPREAREAVDLYETVIQS